MTFNSLPTEQTTAATDALLTLLTLAATAYVWRLRARDTRKSGLWSGVLLTLATGSGLGAVAHGLVLPARATAILWSCIFLALGACVACFAAAAVYDLRGRKPAATTLIISSVVALLVFAAAKLNNDSFAPFIAFEGLAMLAALAIYGYLAFFTQRPGMKAMALGVALTLLAALFQSLGWGSFQLVWSFNHNGTYHLIQMLGLVAIVWGLHASLGEMR